MPWRTIAPVCGTSVTHNCLLILTSAVPRLPLGNFANCDPGWLLSLLLALHKQRPTPRLFLNESKCPTAIGPSGPGSSTILTWTTPTSLISLIPSRSYKSLLNISAPVHSPPAVTLSDFAWWRTTFAPSARRSPAGGP
jgi:hypothetical protein